MDNVQNPTTSQPELKELQAQCDSLQQLVSSLLLVLIVISGTLTIFLARQWRFAKTEVDTLTPTAVQLLTEHSNNFAVTQEFVKRVAEYGRTHPDFGPIVAKYRLNELAPKPGTASVTSSLPAAVSSKK